MWGVPPVQLLPRGHCSHVDGLLRELHHLRAKLHQWVECHDRPGEHPVWFSHHVRRPVSTQHTNSPHVMKEKRAHLLSHAVLINYPVFFKEDLNRSHVAKQIIDQTGLRRVSSVVHLYALDTSCYSSVSGLCLHQWETLLCKFSFRPQHWCIDSLCAGQLSEKELNVPLKPNYATSWCFKIWKTSPQRRYVLNQHLSFKGQGMV